MISGERERGDSAMETFRTTAERVKIVDLDHPMTGECGTIYRPRRGDNGAWVAMDREPPAAACYFPTGDDRHQQILLFPEQCAAA